MCAHPGVCGVALGAGGVAGVVVGGCNATAFDGAAGTGRVDEVDVGAVDVGAAAVVAAGVVAGAALAALAPAPCRDELRVASVDASDFCAAF